jgi:DNA-binding NtrC family response regulator
MARILLVEDDARMRETLSMTMRRKGHTVTTADSGVRGMEKFTHGRFDVVVTDIIMPDMDGIEMTIEMLRAMPNAKILVISGGGSTRNLDFMNAALKCGATAALEKPVRLAEFYEVLGRCLSEHGGAPV